jgi:hypothetical protein
MLDSGPGFYLATLTFMLADLNWYRKYWNSHSRPPLPPAPPFLPIVGSIWLSFDALKSTYGWQNIGGNLLVTAHIDPIYARLLNTCPGGQL